MSENQDQLLIVNVCIQNGNGMASINGATLSGWGRMERKFHHFFDILLDTYVKFFPKYLVKDVHQMIKVAFLCKPNTVNTRAVTCKSAQWPHL